jgi:hypothetical protein
MFKTHEISIGPILRWLLGILGLSASLAGVVLFVWALRRVQSNDLIWAPAALLMLIIVVSGIDLLRSALRGRLKVRSYGRKRP